MRGKRVALAVVTLCILCGCKSEQATEDGRKQVEKERVKIEMESSVPPEECFVCGASKDSLMPYYAKRDSVGIVHWKNFAVINTEVRAYDDDGNELLNLEHFSHKFSSFGKGYGSISVSLQPNRGISDVRISLGKKDAVDLVTTGYCLVDFTDRQLYTLSDPYCGCCIRDYYVTYDIVTDKGDDRIELLIFYAPERAK